MIAILAISRGEPLLGFAKGRAPLAWRTATDALGTSVFLTALFHMSLAVATAILQSLPIVMTVVSALVLGETVRWRRWAAVFAGFAGVVMIIQPGTAGFNLYSLLALAGLGLVAVRDIATRYIPRSVPALTISFAGSVAVMLAGGCLGFGEHWTMPTPRHWLLLTGAAALLVGGYVFIVGAMRSGELSVVAPFRYSIILIALGYGYVVFGDVPNVLALAGITLVVVSGVYVFHREGRVKRRRRGSRGATT